MVDIRTKSGKAAAAAALATVATGLAVIMGWAFRLESLKRVSPGLVAMNPATAVAFILSGASLALLLFTQGGSDSRSRAVRMTARFCAFAVALIGGTKLAAILLGWDLGIDHRLFASELADDLRSSNSMAAVAALNFVLLGGALLFVDRQRRSVRFCVEFACAVAGFSALTAILGYIFNIREFYDVADDTPMALHAAITFILVSVALLLCHTDSGFMAVFAADSSGGTMGRRLLPAALIAPVVLGWLTRQGERAGFYRSESGEAIETAGNILAFSFLVCWSARGLFKAELRRKKAEEAMLESEVRFSGAFEHAPIGVALISPEGRWLKVNRALCDLVGYSETELLAHNYQGITHPEDLESSVDNVHRLITGEIESYQGEKRYLHKNGQSVTISLNASLVRNGRGEPHYLIAQIQDITIRKQAEAARDRLIAILESTTDMVGIADPAGQLLYLNRAGRTLLGVGLTEDISKVCIADFLSNPGSHPILTEGIPTAAREGIWSGETTVLSRSGLEIPISQVIIAHKTPDGRVEFSSTIMRDITERKRLETQLFQSQKMETVGRLAGGVAHEFNTIMTAIIGQSELLLHDLTNANPLHKRVTEIRTAAERAAILTRKLLAYGRKQVLRPEILDLNSVLAGMESTLRHLMGETAEVRIGPGANLNSVKADAGQIEQVILNMAINARDAMPSGGKLTLETANTKVDQEHVSLSPELKAGDYVMLTISDTGTGMTADAKARAFEPFFSTKGIGYGAGLGLSTCDGIIKQSGGYITVHSEPGHGTTFKIYLPRIEQQLKTPIRGSGSSDLPRGTETILLIESDPALREMAATLLRRLGYKVLALADGAEAPTPAQQEDIGRIDLLLTDAALPQTGGYELSERLWALPPHARILCTSANTGNAFAKAEFDAEHLQKPFTPSALARKLREVLD